MNWKSYVAKPLRKNTFYLQKQKQFFLLEFSSKFLDIHNCKLKCSEECSRKLFESYWGLASIERQTEYIARSIENNNSLISIQEN